MGGGGALIIQMRMGRNPDRPVAIDGEALRVGTAQFDPIDRGGARIEDHLSRHGPLGGVLGDAPSAKAPIFRNVGEIIDDDIETHRTAHPLGVAGREGELIVGPGLIVEVHARFGIECPVGVDTEVLGPLTAERESGDGAVAFVGHFDRADAHGAALVLVHMEPLAAHHGYAGVDVIPIGIVNVVVGVLGDILAGIDLLDNRLQRRIIGFEEPVFMGSGDPPHQVFASDGFGGVGIELFHQHPAGHVIEPFMQPNRVVMLADQIPAHLIGDLGEDIDLVVVFQQLLFAQDQVQGTVDPGKA